jgi:glycerol-3-phosphate dehydrogenase
VLIPWGEHWLIGTTDTPWDLGLDHPTVTRADISYLLDHVNPILRRPLTGKDVTGAFAGLRPLVDAGTEDTAKVSREHVVRRPLPGLVTVAGGKYTTYRVMAADAVDAAAQQIGVRVDPSRTADVPLIGAEGLDAARAELARSNLDPGAADRLLTRYGALATEVAEPAFHDPTLTAELPEAAPYLAAEVGYAVSHEGALRLDDVLTRRTRISIEATDRGRAAAPIVARRMAGPLGWSAQRQREEVARYVDWLDGELASEVGYSEAEAVGARG